MKTNKIIIDFYIIMYNIRQYLTSDIPHGIRNMWDFRKAVWNYRATNTYPLDDLESLVIHDTWK